MQRPSVSRQRTLLLHSLRTGGSAYASTNRDKHAIHSAQAIAARNPKDAAGYAGLGAAYFQRARETGDVSIINWLKSRSLTHSTWIPRTSRRRCAGHHLEVCMGEHRFAEALNYAQKALSLGTGDVSPFAIVGDAYADMGEYDKAAAAYSRLTPRDMLLAPRAAYARDSRLSYLKFIAGDTPAAISRMKTAVTEGVEANSPARISPGCTTNWVNTKHRQATPPRPTRLISPR